MYICNQGPLSSSWAHCISCALSICSHCRTCCCCPLQCDRRHMETHQTLQEVQAQTTDHDLCLSCIYSQSFLLHCIFPDIFLEWFSDDNKVICLEVLPEDPRAELAWQGFKHNDEEQGAEYRTLVNTDLHFKLLTLPLPNMDTAPHIGIHPLHQSQNPLLLTKFSQCPPEWLSKVLDQMPSPGLWKPCSVVSCWQLDTSLAVAWQQRLHLIGLSWPALSAWDRGSFLFSMHLPYPCRGRQWTLLPVRGYLAIANDCNCKVTDHGGAHVAGCSYHLHHYA